MENPMILHRIIRQLASWAVYSFFTDVCVIGADNVPQDGPLITTATHHNMMLDPAVLSSGFPYGRIQHYWSKASLFKNPLVRHILVSTGNVPVERKALDRRQLFQGTFDALAGGAAVALFPEGTSYTEPRIMQVKDGASWAALEYTKYARENPDKAHKKPVFVIPAAIVYTNKSKYRSSVILEFGSPIALDAYMDQFLAPGEGSARAAVKRLTHAIESQLVERTINAPDWDTLYASRMARDLLWVEEGSLRLEDFVDVSQTLADLFATLDATPNFKLTKRRLLEYYSLLQSTQLTHAVLASLPLPTTLDPTRPTPVPSRLRTLAILVRDTFSALVALPFFLLPIMLHAPAYALGRVGASLVEHEEETQAQNKVVFGLLFLLMCYPAAFFAVWAFLWYTRIGALIAGGLVAMLAVYHTQGVNDAYSRFKRVEATWRVLLGIWAPKRWEYSLATLEQYTRTPAPPPNPWLARSSTPRPESRTGSPTPAPAPASPAAGGGKANAASSPLAPAEPHAKRKRRPRSGRVMRHVLRARAEAAHALAEFFEALERAPPTQRVRASAHLTRAHGGGAPEVDESMPLTIALEDGPVGWRNAREVVAFLKARGAKTAGIGRAEGVREWAMVGSDGELSNVDMWDSEVEASPKSGSSPLEL